MEDDGSKERRKGITLRTPIGTRDFLPEDMIVREYVIGIIKKVFEEYGYDPMETPVIEFSEVLKGKYGEEEKLIYEFKDRGGRDLALRYDLTVPLSRVMAANPHLPKPFKRYHISRCWRYENPQRGRYREFWQCDVDTVGSRSMLADAELIMLAVDVFNALGFGGFQIRINNRKILDAMCVYAGIAESMRIEALRNLDKIDKIGIEDFEESMKQKEFSSGSIQKVLEFIRLEGKPSQKLDFASSLLSGYRQGLEGIDELKEIMRILTKLGIEENSLVIDLGLARGLDYYTGPIYEIVATEADIGSLAGGGRYDKLIGGFAGTDVPATGVSFGLERIIDVMKERRMVTLPKTKTIAIAVSIDETSSMEALRIARKLRAAGIPVRTDVIGERKITKQLKYADTVGIPYAVIVGQAEMSRGTVKLRWMTKHEEKEMKVEEVVELLKSELQGARDTGR
jgi:histidyl-tRNA synthetase